MRFQNTIPQTDEAMKAELERLSRDVSIKIEQMREQQIRIDALGARIDAKLKALLAP